MLAIKAQYNHGRIEFIEPIPANILSAELNIIVIPSEINIEAVIPADEYHVRSRPSEEEFKQIGLAAFFDTDDDANVDWEDCFGLK
ncbi:MAG: hypothetical protein ACOYL3_00325 [Desulfuromonadaceae bacterium]